MEGRNGSGLYPDLDCTTSMLVARCFYPRLQGVFRTARLQAFTISTAPAATSESDAETDGERKDVTPGTSVTPEVALVGQMLLEVDDRHAGQYTNAIQQHGFLPAVKTFRDVRRTVEGTDVDLNAIFHLSATRRFDPYVTCRSLLTVAGYRSPAEAVEMMKASSRHLTLMAEWIPLQKTLERRLGSRNLRPSASFMRAFLQRPRSWLEKLAVLKQTLPIWCLAKLIESANLTWIEQPVSVTKELVKALEESLKKSMSEELAADAVLVCISSSPSILENSTEQIQKKIEIFREILPGDAGVDSLLKNPKILSPGFHVDIVGRYHQLTAWLQTLSAISNSMRRFNGSIAMSLITSGAFDRGIRRIEYAMTHGRVWFTRNYYFAAADQEFESTHPGFTQWKEAVYGALTEDDDAQKELERNLEEMFNVINVMHFVADFPMFREAVWNYSASETLDRIRFLQYFFAKDHLEKIDTLTSSQLLLEASFSQLDATLQDLMASCGISNDEAKMLIIALPSMVQSDEMRDRVKKNLVLIGEMYPNVSCTSEDAVRFLKRNAVENEERFAFMKDRKAKRIHLHEFVRNNEIFCRRIRCSLEDFLTFQQQSHDKDANVEHL